LIQLIFGEKGSGKTKKILELANSAAQTAKGSTVFVDIDDDYMYDLNLSIRFINATEYALSGPKMFYGFLCGIAASDHDLEYIVVDSFMKIVHHDLETLEELFKQLKAFSDRHNIHLVLSLSCLPEQLPTFLRVYLE
jgi:archaellum biogenesis ATPase FlaH